MAYLSCSYWDRSKAFPFSARIIVAQDKEEKEGEGERERKRREEGGEDGEEEEMIFHEAQKRSLVSAGVGDGD